MFEDLIEFIRNLYNTNQVIPLHEPVFNQFDKQLVNEAIDSTFVSSIGKFVDRFENEIVNFTGTKHALATVNGTSALQVALRLAGVKHGDEVLTQSLTFVATANSIIHNSASPVFLDVDLDTMGMSPTALISFLDTYGIKKETGTFNKSTGKRIAAVLPMHTLGHPCRIDKIIEIADSWNLPVVEDAAEALGSCYKKKHCGTFGLLGVFSFNGNKIITSGGGGAIVTDDNHLAQKAKHLTTTAKVDHPWEFIHDEVGYNYRLPNLNAALACAQLTHLQQYLSRKRLLAEKYKYFFSSSTLGSFINEPQNSQSNFWLNGIITDSKDIRDRILKETNEQGIKTRPLWRLITELEIYKSFHKDDLNNSKQLQDRIINLPSSVNFK